MSMPGELNGIHKEIECEDCGAMVPLQVCRSNAGAYLGYYCGTCGPCSRETDYYRSSEAADKDLEAFLDKGEEPMTCR